MDRNQPQGHESGRDDQQQATSTSTAAQIGNLPLLGALVFSILVLIPATRPVGLGLMLLLAVPIFVGWVRARKLTDGSRRLTTSNAIICGLMVIIGSALSPGTAASPAPTQTAAVVPAPEVPLPPVALAAPVSVAPAVVPEPVVVPGPPAALAPEPVKPAPASVKPAPAHVKPAPAPVRRTPQPAAATCGGDSYINSDGNCVHRPEASSSAPSGATARCKDGEYSFSQHRQGTCSGHGGVANWL